MTTTAAAPSESAPTPTDDSADAPEVVDDWASDDLTPPGGRPWDLLVVGGGTAGIVAAQTAAGFGSSVLLVEADHTGGDCLWTGCVPSKSLLAAAHAAANARNASELGVNVGSVEIDFPAVMAHVLSAIEAIQPVDSPAALRSAGARVARGRLTFTGASTAQIDGRDVTFSQAVVCTGSAPLVPDVEGLAETDPMTSETVWELDELPARLLVLGGGAIGCELGQGFARLGSKVTLVEAADRLLSGEAAAAGEILTAALAKDGVDVRVGTSLTRVGAAATETSGHVVMLSDGTSVEVDAVLVAAGRAPRTDDLGLEIAGVHLTDSGHVKVNDRLQTSHDRIWAAGDVTGHPAFTHLAGVHGSLAASNAVLGLRRTVQLGLVPRVTYTQPEVASYGVSPDDRPKGHTVRTTHHDHVDRAIAEGRTEGYATLVLDGRGRVVGASIVGPHAGESLAEALLAGQQKLKARTLASATHAYPTWTEDVWKGGLAQARADLESEPTRTATRLLARLRRWRVARAIKKAG